MLIAPVLPTLTEDGTGIDCFTLFFDWLFLIVPAPSPHTFSDDQEHEQEQQGEKDPTSNGHQLRWQRMRSLRTLQRRSARTYALRLLRSGCMRKQAEEKAQQVEERGKQENDPVEQPADKHAQCIPYRCQQPEQPLK